MAIQISGTNVIDNNKNVLNVVNGNYSGIVTATYFVGDGSQLTGVSGSGSSSRIAGMLIVYGY